MANSSCVAGSTTATVAAVSSPLKTPFRNPKPNPSGSFLLFSLPTTARGSPPSRRRRGPSIPIRSGSPQPNQRTGIWSIWEDLRMPSSRYFPVEAQGGQGPPPMVQERFQSVISQLFQHRIIRCGGAVDDDMANIIVGAAAVSGRRRSYQGMAIFDTMRHIRPDVSTVCVGLAASMGAFLLSAGTKGRRYSLPNSRIMIHQPLGGAPVSRLVKDEEDMGSSSSSSKKSLSTILSSSLFTSACSSSGLVLCLHDEGLDCFVMMSRAGEVSSVCELFEVVMDGR